MYHETNDTYNYNTTFRVALLMDERVGRIGLPSVAWEATVLPLYDTRDYLNKFLNQLFQSDKLNPPLSDEAEATFSALSG